MITSLPFSTSFWGSFYMCFHVMTVMLVLLCLSRLYLFLQSFVFPCLLQSQLFHIIHNSLLKISWEIAVWCQRQLYPFFNCPLFQRISFASLNPTRLPLFGRSIQRIISSSFWFISFLRMAMASSEASAEGERDRVVLRMILALIVLFCYLISGEARTPFIGKLNDVSVLRRIWWHLFDESEDRRGLTDSRLGLWVESKRNIFIYLNEVKNQYIICSKNNKTFGGVCEHTVFRHLLLIVMISIDKYS